MSKKDEYIYILEQNPGYSSWDQTKYQNLRISHIGWKCWFCRQFKIIVLIQGYPTIIASSWTKCTKLENTRETFFH